MASLQFNADLIDDVARRRIVLFVGAGASKWAQPHGGGVFKDWKQFLLDANEHVEDKRARAIIQQQIKGADYLMASELLKLHLNERWLEMLSGEFQQAADVSRLHSAMIGLNSRIIITTNFDKLLETAWAAQRATRYPTVLSKIDSKAFRLFRDQDDYLIKLHGTIDSPDEIIFDKSSYQRSAFSNQFYGDLLSMLLLTHTFVFVGFSMADPAVSLVIETAAFKFPDGRPHYIFQSGRGDSTVDGLWRKHRKLYVLRYSEANKHIQLAESLENLANESKMRRAELVADGVKSVTP
jgi:hypothetical protein